MVFLLSKLLLFLIKPIVWVFVIFIFAWFSKNNLRRKRLVIIGVTLLFIFSNSFLVGKILNAYEEDYPQLKHYDYGIVLGGFSGVNKKTHSIVFNWSADRLFKAISLYKTGIIDHILITNNSDLASADVKEDDQVYQYLREIGIPDSAIVIENHSRNTIENARNSAKLIQGLNAKAKILIITSAWHIPRARLIFSKHFKEKLTYYPTNYMGKTEYGWSDFIIPSPIALNSWEFLIKEWVGLVVDNFRN